MRLNIPLEDYTDSVREVIIAPYDLGYGSVLAGCNDKDLKTALEILKKKDMLPEKRKAMEAELNIRKKRNSKIRMTGWAKKFAIEWNGMRRAAGKVI